MFCLWKTSTTTKMVDKSLKDSGETIMLADKKVIKGKENCENENCPGFNGKFISVKKLVQKGCSL